jgi:hypothetical protein
VEACPLLRPLTTGEHVRVDDRLVRAPGRDDDSRGLLFGRSDRIGRRSGPWRARHGRASPPRLRRPEAALRLLRTATPLVTSSEEFEAGAIALIRAVREHTDWTADQMWAPDTALDRALTRTWQVDQSAGAFDPHADRDLHRQQLRAPPRLVGWPPGEIRPAQPAWKPRYLLSRNAAGSAATCPDRRAAGRIRPLMVARNRTVLGAGDVEIHGGRIYRIDNQLGHFQPGRKWQGAVAKGLLRLPASAFHTKFQVESVHYAARGAHRRGHSARSACSRSGTRHQACPAWAKTTAIRGRMRSRAFRSRATTVAGILAAIALQYLLGKLMKRVYNDFIEKQIEELRPKVERRSSPAATNSRRCWNSEADVT